MSYSVVPLHTSRDLLTACAEVLNEEWPRSLTARVHSLEKSCDGLPCCLAFLKDAESSNRIILGHCRLSKVFGNENACFVESVVIKKCQRGQGLGRILMELSEKYALKLGYNCIYLTTHDQQLFYEHVGYEFCTPVLAISAPSSLIPVSMQEKLFHGMNVSGNKSSTGQLSASNTDSILHHSAKCGVPAAPPLHPAPVAPPPPPTAPPPPPTAPPPHKVVTTTKETIYWMKKILEQ